MENLVGKTVNLDLVGLDSNAFNLMGQFQRQARREGWTKEEIDKVLNECRSSNYDHLVATLIAHCEPEEDDEDDEMSYSEKKRIADNYISGVAGGMGWDDFADINSLHDCYDEEDIIAYCNDRLEDAGYPIDLLDE